MLKIPKDQVAIIPIGESEKRGSLYVPEQSIGRVKQGIVKYIGNKVESVKIGDYVFFSGYAGIVFRLENEGTLIFMPEDNIVASFEGENARTTDIPGLYFHGGGNEYFTATYEQALILIAKSFTGFKVKEWRDDLYADKPSKTIPGKFFVIHRSGNTTDSQDHMTGPSCFCMKQGAKEYNRGVCPRCGNLLHYASKKTWVEPFWHCENFDCAWNSLNNYQIIERGA